MKIYTKTGDAGETGLFGGGRLPKSHPRIEAYGQVDELNAVLGWAALRCTEAMAADLREIQNDLFNLGAELATPPANEKARAHATLLEDARVGWLEGAIDKMEAQLEPLKGFILPGGSQAAAALHLARTVCRRGERALVALARAEPLRAVLLKYVNRLSDYLFVLARRANQEAGIADVPWRKPGP